MKTYLAIAIAIVMLGFHPLKAECTFSGPGISPGSKKCSSFPAKIEVETEGCYKFTYTGCEAKGNIGTGSGGGRGNNNDNHQWDDDDDDDDDNGGGGGGGSGPITLKASCKDNKPQSKSCSSQINYNKVDDFNKSPVKQCGATPCVFKADDKPIKCKMTFECNGNGTKPNGCFNIHGCIQKEPTPPVGSLYFAVGEFSLGLGTKPPGTATIVRD